MYIYNSGDKEIYKNGNNCTLQIDYSEVKRCDVWQQKQYPQE